MSSWSCPRCTLDNSITTKVCNACGTQRPVISDTKPAGGSDSWQCSTCTYMNQGRSNCQMCGTLRITKHMSTEETRISMMKAKALQISQYIASQEQARQKMEKKVSTGEVNWLINRLYVRKEFTACLTKIEDQIKKCGGAKGSCEFALYVKGLILRHMGKIEDSLQLFRLVTTINPQNIRNIKQVARSLYLLGKKQAALDIYNDALTIDENDWEVYHNQGLCHMHLKDYEKAREAFEAANTIQPHDSTFMQLGKIYVMQNKYEEAVGIYEEALENSPENPSLLTTLGLLFLRMGQNYKAFKHLRTALALDPKNVKGILASGSIIQVR
uniref:RanBP2-type domain-containing protein n=1 Tax=Lotharella globosa TaxID=91324 RepID=A0A7S3ZC92_9EUKA